MTRVLPHLGKIILLQFKKYLLTNLKKRKIMGNILYIVAVILIIGWLVGYFAFNVGGIIHVLLVIAVIAIILQVIRGGRTGL
jgi:hypothetical protein